MTFRIHFLGDLARDHMRRIVRLLQEVADTGGDVGIVALTKVEFIEPDTCEFRYWATPVDEAQITRMHELWSSIDRVQAIHDVDGVRYPWLGGDVTPAEDAEDPPGGHNQVL
jgi:hypothetical protein